VSDTAIPLPSHAPTLPGMRIPARLATRALGALSDRRLAEMAADGAGEQAFSAIYERYHQTLYRYCHSLVRDPDEAADALQSAMLKAYLALPAKRAEIDLRPWLFRIAHNEAISLIRRRAPHDEITDMNSPRAASAYDDAAARARLDQLVDDLQELDERQRAALVMRELSDLSYDDIATAFGTTAATAKQAVYEARVALQERAEGRAMSCEPVRRAVSDGDRRKLRGRKLRAHLRSCAGCRDFELAMRRRHADLAALAPPLPAPAAAALLKSVLGAGAAGSADLGAGASGIGGAATLKTLATLVTITAGAGAIGAAVPSAHNPPAPSVQERAIASVRQAPPLTPVYVLSGGRARVPALRAPGRLVASAPRPAERPAGAAPQQPGARPAPGSAAPGAPVPEPAATEPGAAAPSAPLPGAAAPQLPQVPVVPAPQLPGVAAPQLPVEPVATVAPVVQSLPQAPSVHVPRPPALPVAPSLPALPAHLPR
jgi:RNA polymerase sigma factor (sigma-70 family)